MKPIIRVSHITAGYGEKTILEDVSMEVFPKEIHVIIGGSGCGKSTLLKNIIGLYAPQSGSIEIFNQETAQLTEDELLILMYRIGVLFQNGALLNSLTVAENIALPLTEHTSLPADIIDQLIRLKLSLVGLEHAYGLLPNELSGGMRKRAALARTLALDPEIIFCDEPSAGLDPLTSAGLDELILNLRDSLGMTIVVVSHETESIKRIADKITMLEKGKVAFSGTKDQALHSEIKPVRDFFNRTIDPTTEKVYSLNEPKPMREIPQRPEK